MTQSTRARTLLLIWSTILLAPLLAAGVALLCCRLPIHDLIHPAPGMGACNHEAPSLEDGPTEPQLGAPPSPPPPSRLVLTAVLRSSIAAHSVASTGQGSRILSWSDAGPPAPDDPSQASLSIFRI